MKKRFILIVILIFLFSLVGCGKKKESEKQLIGFTIYEKTNTIGQSQTFAKLSDIEINGVYASDDYSFVSIQGDSLFDVKTDTSKLQGDLITPDSICLFINANYYQSQNVNYKLFLYEIYRLVDGTYSVELRTDVNLSSEIGDSIIANYSSEAIKNELNYVFTYKINFQKIETPKSIVVKEFDVNNQLLSQTELTQNDNEYKVSNDCAYVIIEENTYYLDIDETEINKIEYTFLTANSQKKNYNFKQLNENNRVVNFQVNFLFPNDIEDLEKRSK